MHRLKIIVIFTEYVNEYEIIRIFSAVLNKHIVDISLFPVYIR